MISEQAYALCMAIEELPASEMQTQISVMAAELRAKVAEVEAELEPMRAVVRERTQSAYEAECRARRAEARVRELEKDLGAAVEQKVRAIFNLGRCKALLNTANFKLERLRNV